MTREEFNLLINDENSCYPYIDYFGGDTIALDGDFTLKQLKAITYAMEHAPHYLNALSY